MTQQANPFEQVMSYMRHQAEKGLDNLDALLERTAADWSRCLEGMTEAQATFRSGTEWTAKEVLGHFIPATRSVNKQIADAASGNVTDAPFGSAAALRDQPATDERRSMDELRREVAAAIEETRRMARSLRGTAALDAKFQHPFFGSLGLLEWVAFQRVHAMDHIQQIEKVKADPAYPPA